MEGVARSCRGVILSRPVARDSVKPTGFSRSLYDIAIEGAIHFMDVDCDSRIWNSVHSLNGMGQ
jgi:hypothetical protein